MIYLYAKAIHIIFVICWMAGLFYMPRLFIYHTEAKGKSPEAYAALHAQFSIMENRLWWVITTPAMYLTVAAALVMLYINPYLINESWMQLKLLFVAGLIAYHFKTQQMMFRLRDEKLSWTSTHLRLWNEVSTILLFAIVFIVVLKSALNWIYGVLGLLAFAILLMMLVKAYKNYRKNLGEKVD
ncbi:CopD family protein [Sphingobacterium hungaricum]|uniref:Protoporphyrinogen IX oxidase n=1 Tax=Sphingobacterium hungaricum TaxID=2082723 RepID=A0A928V2T4_9SPHI|nr:CopD family protein [Sphingobacterium hungaricum]MBE8715502.1 protoporphyrinogen IX oxidase [Sphingobacterium hungaricum]